MTSPPTPPAAPANDLLVLVAHPRLEHSRVNRLLLQAARQAADDGAANPGGRLVVRDLYALYPDYLIDTAAEQAALRQAQLVVWVHPVQWYGMPPLLKLWVDEVFSYGWAYGPDGTALRGKALWLVTSTGGPEDSYRPDSYNRYFFDAFLPPYEQTAALCGMRFLPPLLLHGAHRASQDELQAHAQMFVERLKTYPQWPELEDWPSCPSCELPAGERPRQAIVGEDR